MASAKAIVAANVSAGRRICGGGQADIILHETKGKPQVEKRFFPACLESKSREEEMAKRVNSIHVVKFQVQVLFLIKFRINTFTTLMHSIIFLYSCHKLET